MKLLLDSCVSRVASQELQVAMHDVVYAGDWPEDPGDEEILTRAHGEKRVLVTLDKDFGEMVIVHNFPHSGIVRLVNMSAKQQGKICLEVLKRYGTELQAGAIVTAEPGYAKIRSPD